jgi:hypothetical protein
MRRNRALANATVAILTLVSLGNCGGSTPASPTTGRCAAVAGPTSTTLGVGAVFRYRFVVPSGLEPDVLL